MSRHEIKLCTAYIITENPTSSGISKLIQRAKIQTRIKMRGEQIILTQKQKEPKGYQLWLEYREILGLDQLLMRANPSEELASLKEVQQMDLYYLEEDEVLQN